jgi:hypothetical protein
MALIRIKKAELYIPSKSESNQPLVKLVNTILEIDKLTNKNKLVGFSVDKGNQTFAPYTGKQIEKIEIIDTDEGRSFTLGNADIAYDIRANSLTLTAQTAEEN